MKATKRGKQYQITYRCPGYPSLINEYFPSEEEANLRIAQIALEKKQGTLTPPVRLLNPERDKQFLRESITVAQLMDEYVNSYGITHWSEGTMSDNEHRIRDYIIPYIGDIPIKTLTTHRLEQFYNQLLKMPAVKMKGREQEARTIGPSVVAKVHANIRSALNQAIRWDYLRGANPALAVELPRYKKQRRETWDETEARRALELCTDAILKLCIYLALGCSLRIGEILGLTWDCVHMEDNLIHESRACISVTKELRRCNKRNLAKLKERGRNDVFFTFPELKKTGSTTSLVLKHPKTESSVRTVYLPETVARAMQEMKCYQEDLKKQLGSEYQDFNLVIAQNNGRPYEESVIADKLKDLIQANGLKPVVFHSLRHSSTSFKLKISGGDIKAVQGDTGHSQSNMVTDVYSHIMTDDRRLLAQQMDTQFFAPISEGRSQEKAVSQLPVGNESVEKLMKLLTESPEIAGPLLQMSEIMSGKTGKP